MSFKYVNLLQNQQFQFMQIIILIYMIIPKHNNHSFLSNTKRYKQNTILKTIQRQSVNLRYNFQHNQDQEHHLQDIYVSPKSYKFKSTSINHKNYRKNQTVSLNKVNKLQINTFSLKDFIKKNAIGENKSCNGATQKRKNIRQYFYQLSQNKNKRKVRMPFNKTEQLKPAIKQTYRLTNLSLTVQKLQRHQKQPKNIQRANSLFVEHEIPIHYTQIYLFAKKKVRTQPYQQIIDDYLLNQDREGIASKILQGLANRDTNTIKTSSKQLPINQIHPNIAIVTTRQQLIGSKHTQKSSFSHTKSKDQIAAPKAKKIQRKEQQQIGPWNRRNIPQFQYN